ncbi:MAG: hypothetical protein FJ044_02770 [Candidatus Cloacimonetes bacterium]|nr:hypothetical protein [Candidatus Cloacimonadota bacterium]
MKNFEKSPLEQSENIAPAAGSSFFARLKTKWPKIILVAIFGFALLFAAVCAGYWYGTQEISNLKNQISNLQLKIQIQVTPTPTLTATPEATPTPLSIDLPDNWKTYNKTFGGTNFFFRYPETHEIGDLDESSGEIYVIKEGNPTMLADVVIDNMLHIWSQFEPYTSGSRRAWFKDNLPKLYGEQDFSSLGFEEFSFPNGKTYLKVYNWPKTSEFENDIYFQGDFFFGIHNGVVVYILDKGTLGRNDFLRILSSLTASK